MSYNKKTESFLFIPIVFVLHNSIIAFTSEKWIKKIELINSRVLNITVIDVIIILFALSLSSLLLTLFAANFKKGNYFVFIMTALISGIVFNSAIVNSVSYALLSASFYGLSISFLVVSFFFLILSVQIIGGRFLSPIKFFSAFIIGSLGGVIVVFILYLAFFF